MTSLQEPIRRLTRLLQSNALNPDWHPHTLSEGEALTLSADAFQSLVNDQGLVLLLGPPGDAGLNGDHLLSLRSKTGQVECFSKFALLFRC
jgi:hypothetical protein